MSYDTFSVTILSRTLTDFKLHFNILHIFFISDTPVYGSPKGTMGEKKVVKIAISFPRNNISFERNNNNERNSNSHYFFSSYVPLGLPCLSLKCCHECLDLITLL